MARTRPTEALENRLRLVTVEVQDVYGVAVATGAGCPKPIHRSPNFSRKEIMFKQAVDIQEGDFIEGAGVVQNVRVFSSPVAQPGPSQAREESSMFEMFALDTWTADHERTAVSECYVSKPTSIHVEGYGFKRMFRAEESIELCSHPVQKRRVA